MGRKRRRLNVLLWEKSKLDLANEIWKRSVDVSEQVHSYLQENPALYS